VAAEFSAGKVNQRIEEELRTAASETLPAVKTR